MADYTLYCLAQSGNSYKVALLLELAGAKWAPRFVDMFNGEARTAAYREINVMGEVPVLEHGDLRLSQSGVILDYLVEQLGQFGPANNEERREILRWILFDNHKFTSYMATYRFMRNFAPTAADPKVMEMLRTRAEAAWKILDTHLAGRQWVVGNHLTTAEPLWFTLADCISVLVYGELIATEAPERIRANEAVQRAYLGTAIGNTTHA